VLAGSRFLREDRSFVGSRRAAVRALLMQIEPSVLRGQMFPAALATSLLAFAVMGGLTLAVELHLQLVAEADVLTAGLTLVPLSIGIGAASWVGGSKLMPRFGPKLMCLVASAFAFAVGPLDPRVAYHPAQAQKSKAALSSRLERVPRPTCN